MKEKTAVATAYIVGLLYLNINPHRRRLIKQESDEESDEEEDFSAFEDARRELLQREHAEENRVVEWDIAVQDIVAAGEGRQNTSKER